MKDKATWASLLNRRPPVLDTEVEERDDAVRVVVRGRLTIDTSPGLMDEIRRLLKHAPRLEIDLRQVDFIDSSGISVLILGRKLAEEGTVGYTLVEPSSKVRSIIELSQLQEFFDIESSADAT